jgi:hypothetical protein
LASQTEKALASLRKLSKKSTSEKTTNFVDKNKEKIYNTFNREYKKSIR